MTRKWFPISTRRAAAAVLGALLIAASPIVLAQEPVPPQEQEAPPPQQIMSSDQLETLVAPIALYPDPLLSQLLVASTYPLEVVELQQFLQANRGLQGQALMDAAKQQNWDPSVQALAAFPDVVARLNQDVRWTTDLGNAFLAQEADVMSAVQRMRARAQQIGKLSSNRQETVVMDDQGGGPPEIAIQPADPQVVYVPVYDPAWVWGPPVYGYYPRLSYPPVGVGFSFLPGIQVGLFFGDCCGWGGWGGWGWGPNWYGRSVIVNYSFIHRYGFRDVHGAGFTGQAAWQHDPIHRLGVPYPNRALTNAYRAPSVAAYRTASGPAATRSNQSFYDSRNSGPAVTRYAGNPAAARVAPQERQNFSTPGFENRNSGGSRSAFGGAPEGSRARVPSGPSSPSMGGGQRGAASVPAPAPRNWAPRSQPNRGGERR